jgi:hypothetical protein
MAQDTGTQDVESAVGNLFEATPGTESQGTETQESQTESSTHTGSGESQEGQQTQAEVFAEIAGRKYATKDDLFKSHDNAVRQLSKLQQELKAEREWATPWRGWEKFLRENPTFYQQLKVAEQKYRTLRERGVSDSTARKITGLEQLPPEIQKKLQKIDEHDQFFQQQKQGEADLSLKNELSTLQATHKLDDATLKQVCGVMLEVVKSTGLDISAQEAYWRWKATADKQELLQTKEELRRVKGADSAPQSGAPAKAPRRDLARMNEREFDAVLRAQLDGMNLSD